MKMLFVLSSFFLTSMITSTNDHVMKMQQQSLLIRKCNDFTLTGKGDDPEWNKAPWQTLQKLDTAGEDYESKFRILYSEKGIYVFFFAADNRISTEYNQDFEDLYKGDVMEVFFHPEPQTPFYFEYEVNQLNKELVLLISNRSQSFRSWRPWRYTPGLAVKKEVVVNGGGAESNASIASWSAELFFPFALLSTFSNNKPVSGTVWNANFYRLDYDSGSMVKWAWSPVDKSFHEFDKFGQIQFE